MCLRRLETSSALQPIAPVKKEIAVLPMRPRAVCLVLPERRAWLCLELLVPPKRRAWLCLVLPMRRAMLCLFWWTDVPGCAWFFQASVAAAAGYHLVGVSDEPSTWTAMQCPGNLAACTCASAWAVNCDASFTAPCGFVQDPETTSQCIDISPPIPTCSVERLVLSSASPVGPLASLLSDIDDNTVQFAGQLGSFKVGMSEAASAHRQPRISGITAQNWHNPTEWLAGLTQVILSPILARVDRAIIVNVTD